MTAQATKNAIEKRLDILATAWNEFTAQAAPRCLRWLVSEDDASMMNVFFEAASEGAIELVPDLFLRMNLPFEQPHLYGLQLAMEFTRRVEEARAALASENDDQPWAAPDISQSASSLLAFADCLKSFQQQYTANFEHLVIVFEPAQIVDMQAWNVWLYELLKMNFPPAIRFSITDTTANPTYENLVALAPALVQTCSPKINLNAALTEIVNSTGGNGTGVQFRRLFVELSQLAQSGDMSAINRKAQAALSLTQQEKWFGLSVAVHSLVAAVHLRFGRVDEAVMKYRAAVQAGENATANEDPAGKKLVIQSRFGEAAALLSGGRFNEAVKIYEQIAPLTEEVSDAMLGMEAWRMAGYCYENLQMLPWAWKSYQKALEVAEQMEAQAREASTLPYVGQGLLRLSEEHSAEAIQVRARMQALAGADWETRLAQGANHG